VKFLGAPWCPPWPAPAVVHGRPTHLPSRSSSVASFVLPLAAAGNRHALGRPRHLGCLALARLHAQSVSLGTVELSRGHHRGPHNVSRQTTIRSRAIRSRAANWGGLLEFDDFAVLVPARWAFKCALVVVRLIGFDPSKQHLGPALWARRPYDRSRVRRGGLIDRHGGSPFFRREHYRTLQSPTPKPPLCRWCLIVGTPEIPSRVSKDIGAICRAIGRGRANVTPVCRHSVPKALSVGSVLRAANRSHSAALAPVGWGWLFSSRGGSCSGTHATKTCCLVGFDKKHMHRWDFARESL